MSTCIITGCVLRAGGAWVGGDLYEEGDCYVFNTIRDSSGYEADWQYDGEHPFYRKEVEFTGNYFECSGVVVCAKGRATLNAEARAYLEQAP